MSHSGGRLARFLICLEVISATAILASAFLAATAILAATAFLAACSGLPRATPIMPPTLTATTAATPTPPATASASPLPPLPSRTPTSPAPTPTWMPTLTPEATARAFSSGCDQARFVADMTVPQETLLVAGTKFTKTWRVKNTGACTWTPGYAIVFDSGSPMAGPEAQKFSQPVLPGETLDISLVLQAPGEPGAFHSRWKLRNAAGVVFGLESAEDSPLEVSINVRPAPPGDDGYDFIAGRCQAAWTGGDRLTACLGSEGDPNGYVITQAHPMLENGFIDDQPGLLMAPPLARDGAISGKYPVFRVKTGDRFSAAVGCELNAKACNVRIHLDYQIDEQPVQTFAAWNETYDGQFTHAEVDLSRLAGKNVQFILKVIANSASDQNRVLWLQPLILR